MANQKKPGKRNKKSKPPSIAAFEGFVEIATVLIERLGVGIALIIFFMFAFTFWGSTEQKREFFDIFFLGKNIESLYPYMFIAGLFLLTLVGQGTYYKKKYEKHLRECEREVDRLSAWKTKEQEKQIGKKLHHSQKISGG